MLVRKISDGDYCLGHGIREFLVDSPEAVAQNVQTRLALWKGAWFLDTSAGTPWIESMENFSEVLTSMIRARILSTTGVRELSSLSVVFNPEVRDLQVTAEIVTDYGSTTFSGGVNGY